MEVDSGLLERFWNGEHYITYSNELQPSVTTNAHAALALSPSGGRHVPVQILADRQLPDGRWGFDKWHSSWLYTTAQVMMALAVHGGHTEALESAVDGLLKTQREDGSWGAGSRGTSTETAYAVHALFSSYTRLKEKHGVASALEGARRWFSREGTAGQAILWIGKELYRPFRVDRAFELTAMLILESIADAPTT